MTDSKLVLGLDLGVTSIGWALLRIVFGGENFIESGEILASGVRIFPATVEAKTNEPKNAQRRTSRGARRLLRRKRERRAKLHEFLRANGLLPVIEKGESSAAFDALGDPYDLRVRALSEKLEPPQIGRAIFHLAKRRGFLSNRKSGKSKDDGKVYTGIAEVRAEMEAENLETVGQFYAAHDKKRGFYTQRVWTEDEFEKIWMAQAAFHPELLNEHLKTKIKHVIFYQRPIQSQRGLIGKCTFEKDKKRCDMARQEAQRLRFWQDINSLKTQNRTTLEWVKLNDEQREKLAREFEQKEKLSFDQIRKILKLDATARINLESDVKNLYGNRTAVAFRKAIGKTWDVLSGDEQRLLTEDFFRIESETALENRLREFWKFDQAQIEKLLKVELQSGYSRCSLKAIGKILPLMQEGLNYSDAVTAKYGDHRKIYDTNSNEKLSLPPQDLRNPIVSKALHELRKVVNAVVREYGKPDRIHLEMARDLKLTAKQKENVIRQQNQNQKANEQAADFFKQKFGLENVSGATKLKYRLWKEAGEHCPYTGKQIPPETLLDDLAVDIEHIIPYSRSFDDSYLNKTICLAEFNRETKKNKTPFEIFGANEVEYFELLRRIENLPKRKQARFTTKEVNFDEMIGRQLSDTRYICKEARGYLLQLYDKEQAVTLVSGGATANLRRYWHLNSLLADGDVEVKNRYDHRHHAIDAIVVALTDVRLFQYISKLAGRNRDLMRRKLAGIEMPWENFLTDVETAINKLVVSHAPTHRVRGALLEETAYGATAEEGLFVVRKNLESLSKSNIEKDEIVDETVREIIREKYEQFGGDLKKAFVEPLFHKDGKTPIKKVRLFVRMSPETVVGIKDESGKPYKYYALGGNHHVEIYENPATEERKAVLVPRFKAAQNVREAVARGNAASAVSQSAGENWRFLFSLCPNDYIEFLGDDGELRFYRIQKMSGGGKVVMIALPLQEARSEYISGISLTIQGKAFKRIIRKLQVDPLGHLAQAND